MPRGPKGEKRPTDVNARAVMIARIATGEIEETLKEPSGRHCHVAMRKARAVYVLQIFKPPRRPRATWSSPRRVARGEIELT